MRLSLFYAFSSFHFNLAAFAQEEYGIGVLGVGFPEFYQLFTCGKAILEVG